MARPARIELATSWFVARHSIQLSYGRIVTPIFNKWWGWRELNPHGIIYQGILSPSRLPFRHIPIYWRFLPDSNRRSQSCSLLPYHLAKEPYVNIPCPTILPTKTAKCNIYGFICLDDFVIIYIQAWG